jgi:hypothetical protein
MVYHVLLSFPAPPLLVFRSHLVFLLFILFTRMVSLFIFYPLIWFINLYPNCKYCGMLLSSIPHEGCSAKFKMMVLWRRVVRAQWVVCEPARSPALSLHNSRYHPAAFW